MSDLIRRDEAIATAVRAAIDWHKLANPQYSIAYCIGESMRELPSTQPDRELIEQLRWERDTAIQQLKDLGYGLGEKPRTDDTISRQAAIDALVKAIREDPYYDSNEAINGLGVCDVRVILNDLPSAQPEQRWIPCSERMPQPNEEDADGFIKAYLVQDGRWMDVARWNGDCWIAWGYGTALTNVIAWMPLPEPYAERREE